MPTTRISSHFVHRSRFRVCLLLIALLGGGLLAPARSGHPAARGQEEAPENTVSYEVTPLTERTPRLLSVAMHVPVMGQTDAVALQMPVWSPGDYHIQDHARYVQSVNAFDDTVPNHARPLTVTHPDANTWKIAPAGTERILVTYALPETPPGIFCDNIRLGADQVFVNGPAAYLYLEGHKDLPVHLTLDLPSGWRAETPLPSEESRDAGTPTFTAPDYDTLADSPLVMADRRAIVTRDFTLNGVPHREVFFGQTDRISDFDVYTPPLQRIVQAETKIMGGKPPYARYDFFFDVNGGGGGLEHLNACRLTLDGPPQFFAPLVAHEFFHLWNVKRIRPRVLGPFDYIHPPRTRNLWFAEGVTEYYAHVALRRAGLATEEQFLSHWRRALLGLQRNPARKRVTADESSLRVWEDGGSQGYGGLSYYAKGELIGLCLDLAIRHATGNQRSLDDGMRLLLQRHNPPKPGYGEDELRDIVNEVAGKDLSALYDRMARSTEEMPFQGCLGYAGLDIDLKPLPEATAAQIALRKSWMAGMPPADSIAAPAHP